MNPARPFFCFALREEAKPFTRTAASSRVRALITGIGRRNAEHTIRAALAESRPSLVFTCGFAGGLDPQLAHGDIVFSADKETGLKPKLLALGAREVKFFCVDRIIVTAEEKWRLWHSTGADAVEMESEIIRAVCQEQGTPSVTIRVILDTAGESLPLDFNQLSKPDLSLDNSKLALAILKSPGKIGALLRLHKQTKIVAERLAQVLEAVLT